MNEVQRLTYLDAMGINSYIPRVVLPGARPSVLCDLNGCEELLVPVAAAAVSAPATVPGSKPGSSAVKETLQQLQSNLVSQTKPVTGRAAPVSTTLLAQTPASRAQPAMAVHFQWAIFQPVPSLLLLVPVAHLAQAQMQLLQNILAALGISGGEWAACENFVWPPSVNGTSLPNSLLRNTLEDARETLQALLQGYQQKQPQNPVNHVLVFDNNLGKTIFDGMRISELTLRLLPSLHEMTANSPEKIAEAKRVTWQSLKDLKFS